MTNSQFVSGQSPVPPVSSTGRMFDLIAPAYDMLNHILSFGLDFFWHRRFADLVYKENPSQVLDLATGTGDLLVALLRRNPGISKAVALDISENMLAVCRKKIAKHNLSCKVDIICTDANSSGLSDETFDIVTMGFGIRNMPDEFASLTEIHRLLKFGGKVFILEFSMPANPILRKFYLIYLRRFVPLIGRLFSGSFHAYRYLNTSIENFYGADDFSSLMKKSGFVDVHSVPLTFGIVCIYMGSKK